MSVHAPEPMRREQLEDAAAMIGRALAGSNARDYAPEVIRNLLEHYSASNLGELMATRDLFVVREGGRVIATAGLCGDTVTTVFVDPAEQGRGIGALLMRHVESLARSRGIRTLVVPSSLTALGFYRRLGYDGGEIRDDPRFGRVIVMRKSLPG